jgi:plastocyanin
MSIRRVPSVRRTAAVLSLLMLSACVQAATPAASAYQPRTRDYTITTVPLLVKEMRGTLPFLRADFAKGGVLDGQEVYGFVPSTLVAYRGDTLRLTFVNPEDDEHSFVLTDLYVKIPGQTATTTAIWLARAAGIYTARCAIPAHTRSMTATVLVLEPPVTTP